MYSGMARLSRECGECHRYAQGTSQNWDQLHTFTPQLCGTPSLGWAVAGMDPTPTQEVHDAITLCQLHYIHI